MPNMENKVAIITGASSGIDGNKNNGRGALSVVSLKIPFFF